MYQEFIAALVNDVEKMRRIEIFRLKQEKTLLRTSLRTSRAIALKQAEISQATTEQIAELISYFDNEENRLDKEIAEKEDLLK